MLESFASPMDLPQLAGAYYTFYLNRLSTIRAMLMFFLVVGNSGPIVGDLPGVHDVRTQCHSQILVCQRNGRRCQVHYGSSQELVGEPQLRADRQFSEKQVNGSDFRLRQ